MSDPARKTAPPPLRLPTRTAGPTSIRPTTDIHPRERRDRASRDALVCRIIVEYQEMPGLRLTLAQAQRLFGLREDVCVRVLNTVVWRAVLRADADGAFVRNGGRPRRRW
jgi:hypothetical protein